MQREQWMAEINGMKYWLIGLTAALSLMALAPERHAPASAPTASVSP
jgi:hypothetical protein